MSDTVTLQTDSPLPCPKCSKLFRLPDGFTSTSALACPHCQQQVTGNEILAAMAPTAKIVDVPVAAPANPNSGARPTRSFDEQDFVIPKPLKTAQRRSRRHPERKSPLTEERDGPKSSSESSGGSSGKSSGGSSSRSSGKSSSKKGKKAEPANPLAELLKIVLGGVLALPIAQLILWWAFNSDPLGFAPKTSQFAAFLVPPKLQPAEAVIEEEQGDKDLPDSQMLHDDRVPMRIQPD